MPDPCGSSLSLSRLPAWPVLRSPLLKRPGIGSALHASHATKSRGEYRRIPREPAAGSNLAAWVRGLSRGIRLGRHAAWEERQPPPSDLLIGPEGDHIRTVAENHMEVVRHVRVSRMPLLIHLVQRRHVGLS